MCIFRTNLTQAQSTISIRPPLGFANIRSFSYFPNHKKLTWRKEQCEKKIRNKNYFKCDIFFLIICDIFIIANSMFTFRNNRSKPLFSNDNFFTLSFLQANLSTSKKCSKLVFDESFRHLHRVFVAISLFSELVLSVLNP